MTVAGIILGAGSASRFGRDKRRLTVAGDRCLLLHCLEKLATACDQVVAVLRPNDGDLAALVTSAGHRHTCNPNPAAGLGSSLRCGVEASRDADAWLVMPADLPLVRLASIRRVAAAVSPRHAVVPLCHGRRGHPVAFGRGFRQGLLQLPDGGRGLELLRASPRQVRWVNVHDPGIYLDIDAERDAAYWLPRIAAD